MSIKNMGPPRFLKIFTILLLALTYSKSQPVEFLTDKNDDIATSICPEELAKRKSENAFLEETVELQQNLLLKAKENESEKVDILTEATTLCPEEIERKKQEKFKENLVLEEKMVDDKLTHIHTENFDETTTICPEELEKRQLEKQKEQINIKEENTDKLEKDEMKITFDSAKDDDDLVLSKETSTICPEELLRFEQEKNNDSLNKIVKQTPEDNEKIVEQDEITTICPEELEKIKQQKNENQNRISEIILDNLEDNLYKNIEHDDNLEKAMETTICPEELERMKQEKNEESSNKIDNIVVEHNAQFGNYIDEGTTICPKELARKKLEQSQKYLTKFKELVDKAQKRNPFRRKRQVPDYSSYYNTMNQPTYKSEGLAMSASNSNNQNGLSQQQSNYNAQGYNMQHQTAVISTNQNVQSYKPQSYNSQAYNPQTVKTYQQLRKQQYQPANIFQKNPSFYPKTYQNNAKPVKTYRNPSTYVRYPSNGSLNNYYKVNSVGNRRQFQGARPTGTSARPNIRVTRKKKFKPSPVFA